MKRKEKSSNYLVGHSYLASIVQKYFQTFHILNAFPPQKQKLHIKSHDLLKRVYLFLMILKKVEIIPSLAESCKGLHGKYFYKKFEKISFEEFENYIELKKSLRN